MSTHWRCSCKLVSPLSTLMIPTQLQCAGTGWITSHLSCWRISCAINLQGHVYHTLLLRVPSIILIFLAG
ncbi:hypothetical protein R1flu_022510 [Riccia fluitans]|uniref:Uncharacterized protein n=1 Tax=Riccia fluitans TaxID=41844 RepID=A0ABD1XQ28_9MARC